MSLNSVCLVGRFGKDPELRMTQNGKSVTSFRIAVDRNYADPSGQRQADWFDIVAWEKTADFINKYFKKGSMIAVEGRLQTRTYQDKNGNNRTVVEVLASNVSFCGSKAQNESSGGQPQGGYNAAPQQGYYGQPPAQQGYQQPPAYSSGGNDDFVNISDEDDLPF